MNTHISMSGRGGVQPTHIDTPKTGVTLFHMYVAPPVHDRAGIQQKKGHRERKMEKSAWGPGMKGLKLQCILIIL